MRTRAAIWFVAAIAAAPTLAVAASMSLRSGVSAERQVELAGPIRSFSQSAESVTLRIAGGGPHRLTISAAGPGGDRISTSLREGQGHVSLRLPPALAAADALVVTVVPAHP
jgi:hypothetical protein